MNQQLKDVKKLLKLIEGKENRLGTYTHKFEQDLKWLIEQAEKLHSHAPDGRNYTNEDYVALLDEMYRYRLWCRLAKDVLSEEQFNVVQNRYEDSKDDDLTQKNIYASQFKL